MSKNAEPDSKSTVESFVRFKVSLTHAEHDVLLRLLRDAANEPSDVDAQAFVALLGKFQKPNTT